MIAIIGFLSFFIIFIAIYSYGILKIKNGNYKFDKELSVKIVSPNFSLKDYNTQSEESQIKRLIKISDPEKDKNAIFYPSLSFDDAIQQNLKIMDATALTLARDHSLPLKVFNLNQDDALKRIACGEEIGTLIS